MRSEPVRTCVMARRRREAHGRPQLAVASLPAHAGADQAQIGDDRGVWQSDHLRAALAEHRRARRLATLGRGRLLDRDVTEELE